MTLSQVAQLEACELRAAEEIVSFLRTAPALKQAAHSDCFEHNPEWSIIIGLGYSDAQRRTLIYKHLRKLLEEMRRITNGDALKAKELSDLMYLRMHAGEAKTKGADNVTMIAEHRRDVAEGVVMSLREFVHALHDAGGKGRYPHKIRAAQQVGAPLLTC